MKQQKPYVTINKKAQLLTRKEKPPKDSNNEKSTPKKYLTGQNQKQPRNFTSQSSQADFLFWFSLFLVRCSG